jgi:hypothetical protein
VVIPLKAIVGIQQVKKISKKKELPRFRPVSEISLTPDTIQVFTNENIVHHFYCFQPNYEQAWNILSKLNDTISKSRTKIHKSISIL